MLTPIIAPIVGARFRPPAADVLNNLAGETDLILVREPDNQYDPNAVKVMVDIGLVPVETLLEPGQEPSDVFSIDEESRYQLGFIPKEMAAECAGLLDAIGGTCPGKLMFNMEGRPVISFQLELPDAPQAAQENA